MTTTIIILIICLIVALIGLITAGLLFLHFWLFKQHWQIVTDTIGDKIIEVVEELRYNTPKETPEGTEE